ncbi:MAG: signal recognition particle-docking protein FtsY [Anaerolineales bacterium]|nr:signal recognition particle-docking protein FtsY [Anaerolineae bacterium]PWB53004.1 MAG: signal recognition particle-docking protein FtsY [Anaerolineales bacterium]
MNNILSKWKSGLSRTSKATFGQLATLFGATEINDDTWEKLEALLIHADIGVDTTINIIDKLEDRVEREGIIKESELNIILRQELRAHLENPPQIEFSEKPAIILIVGVNGSGKTTTIAKLGKRFFNEGKQVILGAADTFRAAGVDQLEIWADRIKLPIISGQLGGDAGAVAFDTVQAAISRNSDIAIIDTAGRLHTRYNLMEELKKVHRVVGKAMPGAPHAVWLVMDATTGQNAMQQARAFKDAVKITGVILAKLDSSARGGMALSIQKDLGLPILFAGLGEQPDDLQPFDPDMYIDGLLQE